MIVHLLGSCGLSVEEVISVCISLEKIAQHTRDNDEIGQFFHDSIIPRLFGLALKAALHSRDCKFFL